MTRLAGLCLLAAGAALRAAPAAGPPPADRDVVRTGRPDAVVTEGEGGRVVVHGETFRLVRRTPDGAAVTPLDLQDNPDLGGLLFRLRDREVTVVGKVVEKAWPAVVTLPVGGTTIGVVVAQPVLRVSEVRVNFDKAPLRSRRDD